MRKVLLLATIVVLVALVGLLPFDGTDIGKLHPVEVLAVSRKDGTLLLQTDSGMSGTGKNVDDALSALRLSSSGNIFLETANYLLIGQDCTDEVASFWEFVRPACQVYYFKGRGPIGEIGDFLESHPSRATVLRCIQGAGEIPLIVLEGESVRLERE
ncbi:MAG: hypothetical protein E7461_06005 [Ruminococcaceae bacterium]|nr:hypothetical protein [Oscillospiraceae bacterium]